LFLGRIDLEWASTAVVEVARFNRACLTADVAWVAPGSDGFHL